MYVYVLLISSVGEQKESERERVQPEKCFHVQFSFWQC